MDWFERLWNESKEYDLAAIYAARYAEYSPYLIYLRVLWERYGKELEAEAEAAPGSRIRLTTFQNDGIFRARRILDSRNGVLIADAEPPCRGSRGPPVVTGGLSRARTNYDIPKSASKIGSSTSFAAVCTSESLPRMTRLAVSDHLMRIASDTIVDQMR